jgi:hypothetical protein
MTPEGKPILSNDAEQRLRSLLAAEASGDGLSTPDRVERALLGGLRRRRQRALFAQLAVAAALVMAVTAGLFFTRPKAAPDPAPAIAAIAPAPPIPASPVQPATRKAPVKRRRAAAPRIVAAAKEPPSDFIPIGPWQAMEPMERGSIIRVRLPKSSLPGFGIPVSADRWDESIPADVVLAEDGSMRGLRFVSVKQ